MKKLIVGVVVLVLIVVAGLWAKNKFSQTSSPLAVPVADSSSWKTYRSEKYGFEFKYPSSLTVIDPDGDPEGFSWLMVRNYEPESSLDQLENCQGPAYEPSSLELSIEVHRNNSATIIERIDQAWSNGAKLALGDKAVRRKKIPDQCRGSLDFLWKRPVGERIDYTSFSVYPSDTLLLNQAAAIIATFKFTK